MKEAELSVHCTVENDDTAWQVDRVLLRRSVERIVQTTWRDLRKIEGIHRAVALSCYVVGSDQIHELNRRYRRHDAATDMLSFPLGYGAPGRGWVLGDIVICLDEVQAKARLTGNTLDDQFLFSLIHSFLHLIGYDHEKPDQRQVMEQREEAVFAAVAGDRGLTGIVRSA